MATEDEETKQLFVEANNVLEDLRQAVPTPADAIFVLCVAMFLLDREYRKPDQTLEDCINLIGESFREIAESVHATNH